MQPYSLKELSYLLNAYLIIKNKNSLFKIFGLSDVFSSSKNYIVVLNNVNYVKYLNKVTIFTIVLKLPCVNEINANYLVVEDPRLALAKLTNLCFNRNFFLKRTSRQLFFLKRISMFRNVVICNNAVIGDNVIIKDGSFVDFGVVIGNNCIIGFNCFLGTNVVLHDNVIIGDNCYINSNTTIGGDGFGFITNEVFGWEKIFHFGGVIIGNNVEIGCNTTIDRGVFHNTFIDDCVIIDNQVQIAHNVYIGKNSIIAGCVGIGGSVYISEECMIGGGVMLNSHIHLCSKVYIVGFSCVTKSIKKSGLYSSVFPVKNSYIWNKYVGYFFKLKGLFM